jgi:thioredoxin 2
MNEIHDRYTYASCSKCHAVNKVNIRKLTSSQGVCGKCQGLLPFHQLVSETDDLGLNQLIQKSDLPLVVDFWAPWCGPCKLFAPTFETVSTLSQGKLVFVKVNTENYPRISEQFNIRGIPTLIVFKKGKEVARESGAFPLETFKKWVLQF